MAGSGPNHRPPRSRPRVPLPPRAVDPGAPGLDLAKSGNAFAANMDIERIMEVLPHR